MKTFVRMFLFGVLFSAACSLFAQSTPTGKSEAFPDAKFYLGFVKHMNPDASSGQFFLLPKQKTVPMLPQDSFLLGKEMRAASSRASGRKNKLPSSRLIFRRSAARCLTAEWKLWAQA